MKKFKFASDFLWGTATAPTQIDGGDNASDWYEFCQQKGRILDGSSSFTGCDHWNRYKEDFDLMKKMGHNAYRLGADWSRFEPQPGAFDHKALDHFREMLQYLKKKKIKPLLTLMHFAVPSWWLKKGGWTKEENIEDYMRFARWLIENTGDLVHEYITINEPVVYSVIAYMDGRWPPGEGGLLGYFRSLTVQRNLALTHFQLYDLIHSAHARRNWKKPAVSIAKHMRVTDPENPASGLDVNAARTVDEFFNLAFCDTIQSGQMSGGLGKGERVHDGKAWDFFGMNYYSRDIVSFDLLRPHQAFTKIQVQPGSPRNDLNWEIYPEGMKRTLMKVHDRYGLPIRITENGIADAKDAQRPQFLIDHISAMESAAQEGVKIDGYYHWSFMDNFEWAEGYTARFGLVEVDFKTMQRKPRASARIFSKIIKNRGTAGIRA
ncbi:MAG TPA: family 1 glycosylhydrolase [Leptospiraceae bacterium]|nr:family 1 glycosylhydrolase [Leptospiraceae bacterium]HNE25422.1 family 1 glycosylhydrolase [Leptospiraceae bacterium]HNN61003.1 family 1 glycosylhydrolase [Leptospiraceae bacterium]